jgi:hypothetical protein
MQNKQSEFNPLVIVIFVAFACIGTVSTIGGVINLLIDKPVPVMCTVEVAKGHVFVGEGRMF